MDYWGPAEKTRLAPFPVVLDIPNNMAAIPGSGDTPVVFTHTIDVAKFVAASLALTHWDPVTYIMGDKLSWNQVVKLAEAARGMQLAGRANNRKLTVTARPRIQSLVRFFARLEERKENGTSGAS